MRSRAQGQGQKRKALVKAGIQMVAQGQQCTERAARVFIYTHTALSPDMLRDWSERGRKTSIGVGDLSLFARVCLANAPKNIRPDWLVRWADDLFDVNDLGRRDMSPELQQVVQKLDLSVTQPPDNPLSLYEYLDHASQVLEQVRALGSAPGSGPRFVGRGWLEARVDDWLGDPARRSGVFVLVGGAGVGKTAFLAHLVLRREQEKDKRKRYLHVFAGQFPHEANVSYAIQLLAAQIVDHYDLRDYGRRDTLVELSSTPDFLERLLRMAAKTLARDEKIVVVCDALDEAGHGANGNVLGLPTRLPDGVYLVLSHRPVPVALHIDDPAPLSFELKPDDANNLRDIQDYLTGVARQAEVASLLGGREDGERTFIQSLMDKSQGNWMYLHHVVNQVRRGERDPLDLAGLPGGLVSYYARYWCDWREGRNRRGEGPAQWDRLYGPLLATLAVAQERVSVEELVTWTGVDAGPAAVRRLLREKWRDHVEERNGGEGGERYGVYHTSFRDFISGQVDLAGLSPAARYLLDDLKERCGEMHKRIVAHYRRQCSGEWLKLVGEEYARRHLAYHLYHAGDGEALYELVTGSSAWAEARYEIEESYAGYLADLELAWQWAESEGAWDIGRQVRCALVASSLGSLGKGVEPWLVARLVASGIWSAARALAYVQAIEDEQGRSDGLVRLAPFLSEGLAVQALAMAREMRDTGRRARALGELIERVPAEQRLEVAGEVLAAMQTIVDREMASPGMGYRAIGGGQPQIQVLGELVGYLPGDLRDKAAPEVLKVVREKGTPVTRAWVLGRLAKRLNSGDLVDEALAAAREPDNRTERVQALSDLADHVPAGLQEQIIREALAVAQKGGGLSWRAGPLVTVVRHMPKQLKAELLPGVLARVRKMQDRFDRADALCALACHMPPDAPVEGDTPLEVARQAWELVDKLSFEYRYFEGWGEMVSCLPADLKVKALAAARRLPNVLERVKALADIAWYWPGELAGATSRSLLAEALAEARSIGDHWASVQSVCALSEHVPDELQAALANRALAAARQVADEKKRVDALCQVAAQWPAVLGRDILLEALAVARGLDAGLRWKVCQEVIDRLPAEDKAPAAREMLADAVEARDDYLRGRDLAWDVETVPDAEADAMWDMLSGYELAMVLPLAEHLPDEEKAEALEKVLRIEDRGAHIEAVGRIMGCLPPNLRVEAAREVVACAREGAEMDVHLKWLGYAADYLSDDERREAVAMAQTIERDSLRIEALSLLAEYLPAGLRAEVLRQVLAALNADYIEDWCLESLGDLVEYISDDLKAEVLATARTMASDFHRVCVLDCIAAYLPDALMADVLAAVRGIQGERWRVEALLKWAERVSGDVKQDLIDEARETAKRMDDDYAKVGALLACVKHASGDVKLIDQAREAALRRVNAQERAAALVDVAVHRPDEMRAEGLREALKTMEEADPLLLAWMARAWEAIGFAGFDGREAWPVILRMVARQPRGEAASNLVSLAPFIAHLGGEAALRELFLAIRDVTQWWP